MSIPHRCPICEGRGEVGKHLAQTDAQLISKKPLRFACHGCNRTGIIWEFSFTPDVLPSSPPSPYPFTPFICNPKLAPDENGILKPVVPLGGM